VLGGSGCSFEQRVVHSSHRGAVDLGSTTVGSGSTTVGNGSTTVGSGRATNILLLVSISAIQGVSFLVETVAGVV
jgi:hypothetical protein